tara:strand:- start:288 stop:947 length:660 start_codon:yes stop_codon:yes gene_type:complete
VKPRHIFCIAFLLSPLLEPLAHASNPYERLFTNEPLAYKILDVLFLLFPVYILLQIFGVIQMLKEKFPLNPIPKLTIRIVIGLAIPSEAFLVWYEDGLFPIQIMDIVLFGLFAFIGYAIIKGGIEKYSSAIKKRISREYYHESSQVMIEENYENGKKEGIATGYHQNGNICFEESYKNGKLHGISKVFFENGKLKSEENYENGKKISQKLYDESGQLIN